MNRLCVTERCFQNRPTANQMNQRLRVSGHAPKQIDSLYPNFRLLNSQSDDILIADAVATGVY